MTTYTDGERRTYVPAVDLSTNVGFGVRISATGGDPAKSIRLAADGTTFIGVLIFGGVAPGSAAPVALHSHQRAATVQTSGTVKAIAQAAIAQGAAVTVHSDGRFRTATTGEAVIGVAEEAAANAGDTFSLRLERRGAAA